MRKLLLVLPPLLCGGVWADDWPAVNPAELAMSAPKIDPDADAEALLWDVRVAHAVDHDWMRTEFSNYIRIKIFSGSGRDRLGTVSISYFPNVEVSDIAGRTIRPNGTVVELQKDSIYDRTLVKTGGVKLNAKSFAMPGLEVGSILEYRWKETLNDQITNYFRLQFQRDVPIHVVRYHIKPIVDPAFPYDMRALSMHMPSAPFRKEREGFFMTSAEGISAFKEEPDMPPEVSVRPWMLVYYSPSTRETPPQYWRRVGTLSYQGYQDKIKLNDEMRSAAVEAVRNAKDDEGRIGRLFGYVVSHFKNTRPPKENGNSVDTWTQKAGTGYDITMLFLALAKAAGYEARLVRAPLRSFGSFDGTFLDTYFLRTYCVAVKVGNGWRFCDPASSGLPFGMLRSDEEGQMALLTDPVQPQLLATPTAPPEASLTRRESTFRLDADGTLEGDVRISYTGHSAADRRSHYELQSEAEREVSVREGAKRYFGEAEVNAIKVEGLSNAETLSVSYHVKTASYAQRSGRRLFLQCASFHRNLTARYSASVRKYPVAYTSSWSEKDAIVYQLPAGYRWQEPRSPGRINIPELGEYVATLDMAPDGRTLIYHRDFDFGRNSHLVMLAETYPNLKRVFDAVQQLDNYSIELRQEAN
ncbi:MAG TPA: DUF3857 and transglutaminase domain-containing protein [Vicinamibacteria bacterium]|nr:DUF3857 and transglutaminase domain-containing protein [Vicinamibacteria bacterium]